MKLSLKGILLALLMGSGPFLSGQSGERWIFEGLITEADVDLAPDLQSGWVLSGSFLFAGVDMVEEPVPAGTPGGRLSGGITGAELTVDLYHQLHFEAVQVPGMAGFDYQDNDPEAEGRDLLGWFLPVRGQLKATGWSARWLQVWLVDSAGKMIPSVPPQISPYGLAFEQAWFRLTFEDGIGTSVHVDGRMDVFAPEGRVDETDGETHWRGVAVDLSRQLVEKDSVIDELREDLAAAQARLSGLRNMVDLLVQERTHLQQENALLAEQAERADPEVEDRIEDLTAEKSLLEAEMQSLSEMNAALAQSLADSEVQRRQMMDELDSLKAIDQLGAETGPPPASVELPLAREGQPVGTMTIVEQPMIIEKPVVVERVVPASGTVGPPASREGDRKAKSTRRHGPRKFR